MKFTLDAPLATSINVTSAEAAIGDKFAAAVFDGGGVASLFGVGARQEVVREPVHPRIGEDEGVRGEPAAGVGDPPPHVVRNRVALVGTVDPKRRDALGRAHGEVTGVVRRSVRMNALDSSGDPERVNRRLP